MKPISLDFIIIFYYFYIETKLDYHDSGIRSFYSDTTITNLIEYIDIMKEKICYFDNTNDIMTLINEIFQYSKNRSFEKNKEFIER